jgi:cell division protein FtsL
MQPARKLSGDRSYGIQSRPYRHQAYRPDPQRGMKKVKLFFLCLTCLLLSLMVVAQYSSLVLTNYRLSSARIELAAIQETTKQLELEVARLSSVSLIDTIAKTELGMVEPELSQLRIIANGRVLSARFGE